MDAYTITPTDFVKGDYSKKELLRTITRFDELGMSEWRQKFDAVANVYNTNAEFDGLLWLPSDPDELAMIQHVHERQPRSIWTLIEGEYDSEPIIVEGLQDHGVIGFFITRKQWRKDTEYQILIND